MRKRMKSSLPLLLAVNLLCLVLLLQFLLLMKRMMMLSATSLASLRKTDFKIT
jgi:hypothetical protein